VNGKQFADALILEIEKRKRHRVTTNLTWDTLADLIRSALDPQPEQPNYIPSSAAPAIPPEYPKLKVLYDASGQAKEWIFVESIAAEAPYHSGGWYTRPMSELESLKAANVPERAAEEWQRRKQLAGQGK
jgi:hypothetical protein